MDTFFIVIEEHKKERIMFYLSFHTSGLRRCLFCYEESDGRVEDLEGIEVLLFNVLKPPICSFTENC